MGKAYVGFSCCCTALEQYLKPHTPFEGSVATTAKKLQLNWTKPIRTEKMATDYNQLQLVFDYIIKLAKTA